jgi:hypothetical protein
MTQSNARMYQIAVKEWKLHVFHCRSRNTRKWEDGNQGKDGLTSFDPRKV